MPLAHAIPAAPASASTHRAQITTDAILTALIESDFDVLAAAAALSITTAALTQAMRDPPVRQAIAHYHAAAAILIPLRTLHAGRAAIDSLERSLHEATTPAEQRRAAVAILFGHVSRARCAPSRATPALRAPAPRQRAGFVQPQTPSPAATNPPPTSATHAPPCMPRNPEPATPQPRTPIPRSTLAGHAPKAARHDPPRRPRTRNLTGPGDAHRRHFARTRTRPGARATIVSPLPTLFSPRREPHTSSPGPPRASTSSAPTQRALGAVAQRRSPAQSRPRAPPPRTSLLQHVARVRDNPLTPTNRARRGEPCHAARRRVRPRLTLSLPWPCSVARR